MLVEHEDGDRVVDDCARVLHGCRGRVGIGLRVEDGDDELLLGHGVRPFVALPPRGGAFMESG